MKTLLVILGPTGVGKTELSLQIAQHYHSPIINADSRQIYNGITIGTAAPTPQQLAQVKHYFVHTLQLHQYYSAAQYEADAITLLSHLFHTHDTLVLTGGSMMYIDAITKGIDNIPTISPHIRHELQQRLTQQGIDPLLAELKTLDPEYYQIVDKKNHKRVVHALEICHQTGTTYTSLRTHSIKPRPFRIIKIGLQRQRDQLFTRINQRVDQMMADGLLDEAKQVYHLRHLNSLNTVGYKELFKVIEGEWQLPMAIERIKKNTRVYAKKQMTWYKHDQDIHWIDADTLSTLSDEEKIKAILKLIPE